MTVMRSGPGGLVPDGAPPDAERIQVGTSVGRHPVADRPTYVLGLVSTYDGVSGMPSQGIQGEGGGRVAPTYGYTSYTITRGILS